MNLKDQRDIARVIEYLVEVNTKNSTVADVMERFRLTPEEYRMCSNLAVPALAQGNMKGRFMVVSRMNKAMRKDVKALYEAVKDEEGLAAEGVRMLYAAWCTKPQSAVYGHDDGEAEE